MRVTASQTIGPFFRVGMSWMDAANLVPDDMSGAITVAGRVLDGAGEPVPDAVVEIWQADGDGAFPSGCGGFGRCFTDDGGKFRFVTIKPGRVDDEQSPHIDVSVLARGLLQRVVTRMYFPDEQSANDADPVLGSIAEPKARATLVAVAAGAPGQLNFDIHLQSDGEDNETVFFVY